MVLHCTPLDANLNNIYISFMPFSAFWKCTVSTVCTYASLVSMVSILKLQMNANMASPRRVFTVAAEQNGYEIFRHLIL